MFMIPPYQLISGGVILRYSALSRGFDVLRSTHKDSLIVCQVSASVLTQPYTQHSPLRDLHARTRHKAWFLIVPAFYPLRLS